VSDCIFCAIVAGDAPATRVYEDERTLAFMDINPATDGHALVIPKAHARDLFDLGDEDADAMFRAVRTVAAAAKDAFGVGGVNLVQANGAVAFQTVFHVHVHVVPRYRFDELALPWIPRPGDRSMIANCGESLRAVLGQ
jgi:histidine triad (HIT) family protein